MTLKTDNFEVDCRPTENLHVTAVRYQPENPGPVDGITLVLAHGLGVHKETWAPLLKYLFDLDVASGRPRILEAWSIENPNHGASAVLNEKALKESYPEFPWSGWIYPRVMLAFLQSKPAGVDFRKRNVMLIGHSIGGLSILLLDTIQKEFNFHSFVLLDPTVCPYIPAKIRFDQILLHFIWNKRDTWSNRAEAKKDLTSSPGHRNWHPETMDLYIQYGLRDHFASKLPKEFRFKGGVTLAATRVAQAACVANPWNGYIEVAWDYLKQLYRDGKTVHLIHSKNDEFEAGVFKKAQAVPDEKTGRGPASVQQIEKGGHMFVQTMPEATAKAIYNTICWEKTTETGVSDKVPSRL